MRLFHFTSATNLKSILQAGLQQGLAAVGEGVAWIDAVWLTTQASRAEQGWADRRHLDTSPRLLKFVRGLIAEQAPYLEPARKLEMRLTVDLARSDSRLIRWPDWIEAYCAGDLKAHIQACSPADAAAWWLYFGTVKPEAISSPILCCETARQSTPDEHLEELAELADKVLLT